MNVGRMNNRGNSGIGTVIFFTTAVRLPNERKLASENNESLKSVYGYDKLSRQLALEE
jgi:hypothetical protein